jgi:hypothetical protein
MSSVHVHSHVRCCVCGTIHRPGAIPATALYRSADQRWWCANEIDCWARARAAEWADAHAAQLAAMYRALESVWDSLEKQGWRM